MDADQYMNLSGLIDTASEGAIELPLSRAARSTLIARIERDGLGVEAVRELLKEAERWARKWGAGRVATVAVEQAAGESDWDSVRSR